MNDAGNFFRAKRITVMGLGLLGRGIGDTKFLAACGAELVVTDLKPREDLAPSLRELEGISNITFVLGEHRLEDFRGRDLILKAAGVPTDSPYIAEAKKNGIPVRMSADLFAELSGIPAIGVTGTRGKSTVTHMIAAIFEAAGKKVILGGNIRGVSTLSLLNDVTPDATAVLELDSWQLQGWGEAKMSPHIAVFTTFYPDHLNYYGSTALTTGKAAMDAYLADKANIFLYQKPADLLVLGTQCAGLIQEKYQKRFGGKFEIWGAPDLPSDIQLRIPGEHNRYDAALAFGAARFQGIDDADSMRGLEGFAGVPDRLELVREMDGVKYYNDTTATTPEATIAALKALDPDSRKNIVLIMGGSDKGLDMSALRPVVHAHCKKVLFLSGSGTEKICSHSPDTPVFDSLQSALAAAVGAASTGDRVLMSPAFASFGMFKNEYDRGEQFRSLVKALS